MITPYIYLAFRNLTHRKLRSILTIVGIVIGITAIVSLLSISSGLKGAISSEFEKMGSNKLFVTPKTAVSFTPGKGLTNNDVKALERLSEFKWVTPYLLKSSTVEFNNERKKIFIYAGPTDNIQERWGDFDLDVTQGRLFTNQDKYSAIIGQKIHEGTFDEKVRVNNNIEIDGKKFRIVGIFKEFGNPQDDSSIQIPIETARELYKKPDEVNLIDLVLSPGVNPEEAANKAKKTLLKERGEKISASRKTELNFEVSTPDQILGQLNTVLLIVQIVLISIASISLIVGAIGIMNSMYTNVLERTKEIGVMKAVGAKAADIKKVFLLEAGVIGLIGGVIGVLLGIIISKFVEKLAAQAGFTFLKIAINPYLIIFSLIFAVGVGMISGYLPTNKASKLEAAEALKG
ncbi:ABC transporter permease [Candidatus Woesearchaeota archaeon]|nr:ABC transporter permease [Candidatus Woesearchaeota archaeon]